VNHPDPLGLLVDLGVDTDDPAVVDAAEDESDYLILLSRLACLREERGLSQKQVADLLGTKQSAISRLEAGVQDARYSTLQAYARAVGGRVRSNVEAAKEWDGRSIRIGISGVEGDDERPPVTVRMSRQRA